ncbi:MAG TPA: 50S ribosomal protein L34 [Patescibacteria group bacterium]|nr:50S ribosomal protein L34 [Patescibacteria group bacterium]
MSVTYNKKTKKRKRTHGFRKRMKTSNGKRTLSRRRNKKRWKLAV